MPHISKTKKNNLYLKISPNSARVGSDLNDRVNMASEDHDSTRPSDVPGENNIPMNKIFKSQYIHRILAGVFFAICVLIVLWSRELWELRGFIWDVIIVMLLYSTILSFCHIRRLQLTIGIVLFAYCIELLQYLHFGTLMGWESNPVARLIFGSVFDPVDLIAYMLGWVLIYIIDMQFIKK